MSRSGKNYTIPVSNGIFDHRSRIGAAIWVFMWCIDHTTKEVSTGDGKADGLVYNGRPVLLGEIASELELCATSVREQLSHLAKAGYIRKINHGNGRPNGYAVVNSKRFNSRKEVNHETKTTPPEKHQGSIGTPPEIRQGTPPEKHQDPARNLVGPRQKSITVIKETKQNISKQKALPAKREPGDPKFKVCVTHLADYWKEKNPRFNFPFGKPGGQQLKAFLENNPDLTVDQFSEIVRNRSLSQKNHADPPHVWLPDAMKYAGGPLNAYSQPLSQSPIAANGQVRYDDPITQLTELGLPARRAM
jgi:hypothetical protein